MCKTIIYPAAKWLTFFLIKEFIVDNNRNEEIKLIIYF